MNRNHSPMCMRGDGGKSHAPPLLYSVLLQEQQQFNSKKEEKKYRQCKIKTSHGTML